MGKRELMFWLTINAFGVLYGYALMIRRSDWAMVLVVGGFAGLLWLVNKADSL